MRHSRGRRRAPPGTRSGSRPPLSRGMSFGIESGASSGPVTRLVIAQPARPVASGLLAGVGFAAALATVLIALPAGDAVTEIVRVADPVAYVASVLTIVAACLLAAW